VFGFGKSFRIFRIWDVDIEINISWIFILAYIVWIGSGMHSGSMFPKILTGFFFAALFFFGLFLHEFSHAVVSKLRGINVSKMEFVLIGAAAFMDEQPRSPKDEFLIGIAGPLMSFLIAGVLFLVAALVIPSSAETLVKVVFLAAILHGAIGVFNSIPAYPLDGGRFIARALLWKLTGNALKSMRQATQLGEFFGKLLIAAGLAGVALIVLAPEYLYWNPWWTLFIGFFVMMAAKGSYLGYLFTFFKVKDCMREFAVPTERSTLDLEDYVVVSSDLGLDKLLDKSRASESSLFFVEEDGKIVGEISITEVRKFIEEVEKNE